MNERIKEIFEISKNNRIPISCTLEITSKCNFKCLHCYMNNIKKEFMPLQIAMNFLKEFKNNGGIFLTLTGGETLLHPHFKEIYIYAKKLGLSVTIFTNGSLLNDEHFIFLSKYKPKRIEITLYGSSDEKYSLFTGCKDVFEKIIKNIKKLKECDINVCLKSVITNYNIKDFYLVKQIAKDMDIDFRFDYYIWPSLDGNKKNLEYQCTPKEIVDILIGENPDRVKHWQRAFKSSPKIKCFDCNGGRNSFYVTSKKQMKMCLYGDYFVVDLNVKSLKRGWHELGEYILKKELFTENVCLDCKYVNICDACPAYFYAHSKSLTIQKKEYTSCLIAYEKAVRIYKNINCIPNVVEDLVNLSFEKTNTIRTYIVGDSMVPTYNDGDTILKKVIFLICLLMILLLIKITQEWLFIE